MKCTIWRFFSEPKATVLRWISRNVGGTTISTLIAVRKLGGLRNIYPVVKYGTGEANESHIAPFPDHNYKIMIFLLLLQTLVNQWQQIYDIIFLLLVLQLRIISTTAPGIDYGLLSAKIKR